MADNVTKQGRSALMSKVRRSHTKPELAVRRFLHRAGLRFRLHRGDLPGRPDIVLPRWRTVIFVHGCFWHRHRACKKTTTPAQHAEFWLAKFAANIRRDRANQKELRRLGWRVVLIWECETAHQDILRNRIIDPLDFPA